MKNRLLDEESKRNDQKQKLKSEVQSLTAFSSQTGNNLNKNKNKSTQSKTQQRFPFAYNNCGIKEHKAVDCCRKPQKNQNNNTKSANVASEVVSTRRICKLLFFCHRPKGYWKPSKLAFRFRSLRTFCR